MAGKSIIALALSVFLASVLCVAWPHGNAAESASAATPHAVSTNVVAGLPYRGVGMQIQRVDWIDKYEKSIDEIAGIGADTVLLVMDARQENGSSSHIYLDMRMTPTPEKLQELIRHAKSKNLRVIVMPIVLLDNPKGNEWRGTIKPESWEDWWDSYRAMIMQFAWVSQGAGADVLVVGSELVSTEPQVEEWTRTIAAVRDVFKGNLTYSANWDHYTSIPFWDQLDLLSMNSYYKLGDDATVTVPQIEAKWRKIQHDQLTFATKIKKPLLFTEVGWCSLANAASEPWDYTQESEPVDLDLQKRLYEAFFNVWHGNPQLGGFNIWEWPPSDSPNKDRGYTPQGKPAEKVLREWLAKPAWQVK